MTAVKIVMVIISSLLIGAHFFRWGYYPLVIVSLLFPLLLAVRRTWATGVVQLLLLLAGIEWIKTLILLVSVRRATGMPWTRLSVILGSVAAFTIASAIMAGVKKKE
ncbi:MAG: hypothetical protein ABRQ37_26795 [Candidatus Eremiobacterota bacterium]